ncbi:hypothetical protein SAMN04487895_101501 [Paenibacillus sophorae]|uniref:Uncharacterized protein n=1 Tax=Paenibacillus sophorae TaxID=1333845 RepID=A0A1H8GG21_9BACL|nr:hypothetical protein [Paenibacillus sophorae]QWU14212.1 hypothetical protein KP014_20075 [Paenibacillus sophorae]SEN42913.1 hypothetical protein SAMN04487895_101501 [Paenibacillus sophorae]
MSKKNKDTVSDWSKAINDSFTQQRKVDEMLQPSKLQIRYLTGFAKNIYDYAQLMNNASEMAHQKLITFELAQQIMDTQGKNILKDIEYLQGYLKDDGKED